MRCVSGCSLRTYGCSPRHLRLQASSSWAACSSCSSPSPRPSASSELAARSRRGRGEVAARSRRGRGGEVAARSARITQGTHIMHLAGGRHGADPTYYSGPMAVVTHCRIAARSAIGRVMPPALPLDREGLGRGVLCARSRFITCGGLVFLISKRPPREERARRNELLPPPLAACRERVLYGCERNCLIGACPYLKPLLCWRANAISKLCQEACAITQHTQSPVPKLPQTWPQKDSQAPSHMIHRILFAAKFRHIVWDEIVTRFFAASVGHASAPPA